MHFKPVQTVSLTTRKRADISLLNDLNAVASYFNRPVHHIARELLQRGLSEQIRANHYDNHAAERFG